MIDDSERVKLGDDVVGRDEAELQQQVLVVAGVDDRQPLQVQALLGHRLKAEGDRLSCWGLILPNDQLS